MEGRGAGEKRTKCGEHGAQENMGKGRVLVKSWSRTVLLFLVPDQTSGGMLTTLMLQGKSCQNPAAAKNNFFFSLNFFFHFRVHKIAS